MPAYRFEALQADGATRKGVIEADSLKTARSQLRAQSLVPLSVEAIASGSADPNTALPWWQRPVGRSRAFSGSQRAVWTRQLAGLVGSGLPIERALTALAEEADDDKQRQLMAAIRAEVNGGSSLGHALAQHPGEFPAIDRAVIAAGEQSGHLGMVLEQLANDLEDHQALRAKLMGAALYPAIVCLVALAIVIFLVTSVVPQVAGVFAGTKRQLPMLTVAMLGLSDFVRQWGWLMLGLAVAGLGAFRMALRQSAFRLRFDAAFLRLPLIGRLARGYNSARFASTLAMLTAAGVPILKALQAAADTLSNQALRADALEALVRVREGAPLGNALAQHARFPGLLSMFAKLGEQTGQLPVMLQRAAQQLSSEVQRRAMALATVLEPLLIVGMGGLVMLIVLAVLMPIMELNQWVK
ncbi:type II secretion system inner membrane protein GspF [Limnohabitans lacus]|uniref:Type II secretion system inner membrane protein GspF n=1 Tax=Limnohabitans lacus TaxID=3045173 RepID=A0ABT6X6S3_9BURK|nr:type II secretion system inner membrane protein GspF [Limnohabitans sp. HM2-2]MDI9233830.1 type II secretion system inner membrane protein GspF [Limnohabitans sp. HM2-2]